MKTNTSDSTMSILVSVLQRIPDGLTDSFFIGKVMYSTTAHTDAVTGLALDPHGLYLLSGSKSTCIHRVGDSLKRVKDSEREQTSQQKDDQKIHTHITQKPGSQVCPLFRVQRTKAWVPSVSIIQSTKDKSLGPKCVHYSEYKGQKPGSQVCPLFGGSTVAGPIMFYTSTGHDGSLIFWSMDSKMCIQHIGAAHRKHFDEAIYNVTCHSSEPFFASAGADGIAKVFI